MGQTLGVLVGIGAALSVLTFAVMAFDKHRARRRGRRMPETTLHLLELLGGWPGSLLASRWLRHKSAKPRFRIVRGACIVVHLAAAAALLFLMSQAR